MSLSYRKDPYILLSKLDLTGSKRITRSASNGKKLNYNEDSSDDDLSTYQKKEPNEEQYSKKGIKTVALSKDSNVQNEMEHIHAKSKSRRKCVYCFFRGIKSLTFWYCKGCGKHLCNRGTKICFLGGHSRNFDLSVCQKKKPNKKQYSKKGIDADALLED